MKKSYVSARKYQGWQQLVKMHRNTKNLLPISTGLKQLKTKDSSSKNAGRYKSQAVRKRPCDYIDITSVRDYHETMFVIPKEDLTLIAFIKGL